MENYSYSLDNVSYEFEDGVANFTQFTSENNFWVLPVAILPIVTILGNILVIMSVWREKTLQNSTNWLIVSLAFADLLVGLIVMPWGIYATVSPIWRIPFLMCDIYISMDVICSTASILNLVAISIDRYEAVTNAVKYSQSQSSKSRKKVGIYLTAVWSVATALGLPIILGLNNSTVSESESKCTFNNPDFIIFSSLASFYVPCVIIVVLYHKILKVLAERAKQKSVHEKNNRGPRMPNKTTPAIVIEKSNVQEKPESKAKNDNSVECRSRFEVVIDKADDPSSPTSLSSASSPDPISKLVRRLSGQEPCTNMPRKLSKNLDMLTAWWTSSKEINGKNPGKIAPDENSTQSVKLTSSEPIQCMNRLPTSATESCLNKIQNVESIKPRRESVVRELLPLQKTTSHHLAIENGPIEMKPCSESLYVRRHKKKPPPPNIEKENTTEPIQKLEIHVHNSNQDQEKISKEKRPETLCPEEISDKSIKPDVQTKQLPPIISSAQSPLTRTRSNGQRKPVVNFFNPDEPHSSETPLTISPYATPASPSPNITPSQSPCKTQPSTRRLGIAASARLLRRAASWRSKSMEKLLAKQERRETRATKTLAIVLGCFLCCWIPFFTCNILSGISMKFDLPILEPSMTAFLCTTWLGYINSALNPFIYTIFNKEFRKAFKKILKNTSDQNKKDNVVTKKVKTDL